MDTEMVCIQMKHDFSLDIQFYNMFVWTCFLSDKWEQQTADSGLLKLRKENQWALSDACATHFAY